MYHVEHLRITNERIRQEFQVPTMMDHVHRRQLQWIHKIATMPSTRVPLPVSVNPGSTIQGNADALNSATVILMLQPYTASFFLSVDPSIGKNEEWLETLKEKAKFKTALNEWWESKKRPPADPNDDLFCQ